MKRAGEGRKGAIALKDIWPELRFGLTILGLKGERKRGWKELERG